MMSPRADTKTARGVVRRGRVTVSYERAALSRQDAAAFAALAVRGLREIERLANLRRRARLRFELRAATRLSTARGRTILLSTWRVASRSAPYLHEIAHALLPCRNAPAWFSEGLASYLEALVSERGGGYDSRLFTLEGNLGIHADAARWLADSRGRKVLRFVGTRGMPRNIVADRHNVAGPFYVLSHSMVKCLADQAGISALFPLARARPFAPALRRLTGKPARRWRALWLAVVAPAPRRPKSPSTL